MRKYILTAMLASIITSLAVAQNVKFVDATDLAIYGYTKKTDKSPYYRFDHTPYKFHPAIVEHALKPSGLYVAFKTNSTKLFASWDVVPMNVRDNMPFMMLHGLDLYTKVDGEWSYVMAPRIPCDLQEASYTKRLIKGLPHEEREYLLYLPIWCELKSLRIGVDKDATIEALDKPFRHKVIVFGSSITHGAAASRPGLTYTAQMSRNLGIDFVNFGFAGQCKMQPEFLRFLQSCEADAFLFDTFSNPTALEVKERLEGFVEGLVKAHPGKPLIFMQTAISHHGCLEPKKYEQRKTRLETVRRMMNELVKRYKDVYFLEVENVAGRDGTIDTTHPNDLGFNRFVEAYQPKIAKILKKYGIK